MKTTKTAFVTKFAFFAAVILITVLITSCQTINQESEQKEPVVISRYLTAQGVLTADQLADFFLYNAQTRTREELLEFAQLYINEAAAENINSDIAHLPPSGPIQPKRHRRNRRHGFLKNCVILRNSEGSCRGFRLHATMVISTGRTGVTGVEACGYRLRTPE